MEKRKVNQKIKALMKMKGKSNSDLASALDMSYQVFTNKLNQKSFYDKDLIKIGKETGTKLAFIDDNNLPVIIFTDDDI